MTADDALIAVRRDIDAIDDKIHDLIMQRTELVERVKELKRDMPVKIRPTREAAMLYRLVARHRGPFPKRYLVSIWRQLINATLAFEGPFSIAVYMPEDVSGYWDLARDHFGIYTAMTRHYTAPSVIDAVRSGQSTVGILPLPRADDADPWWRHLVADREAPPGIIARLPFAGPSNGLGGWTEALAICALPMSPSGRDRSLFVVAVDADIRAHELEAALRRAELCPTFTQAWRRETDRPRWLHLVEVDGFVGVDDPRLRVLTLGLGDAATGIVNLGGYARPFEPAELNTGPTAAAAEHR